MKIRAIFIILSLFNSTLVSAGRNHHCAIKPTVSNTEILLLKSLSDPKIGLKFFLIFPRDDYKLRTFFRLILSERLWLRPVFYRDWKAIRYLKNELLPEGAFLATKTEIKDLTKALAPISNQSPTIGGLCIFSHDGFEGLVVSFPDIKCDDFIFKVKAKTFPSEYSRRIESKAKWLLLTQILIDFSHFLPDDHCTFEDEIFAYFLHQCEMGLCRYSCDGEVFE